ncbi:MAG: ZmpA/ZmpB/ZmpC family metallo-endopeptidase-related protein [Suipraeoptans sp.]
MRRVFKKQISLLLAVVMIFALALSSIGAKDNVSEASGYTIINTAAQLDAIRNNLSGKYKLGADIDLSDYSYNSSTWTSSGGWLQIGTSEAKGFTGELDGDGHTIKGLWSNGRGSNSGLFGWITGGTVKNLNIELKEGSGILGSGERRGALAGDAYKGSVIENVHVAGAGRGSSVVGSANYISGLVGVVKASTITSSSVSNVSLTGGSYVGGIAGVIYDKSKVVDSHVTDITATGKASYVGGFIGCIYGGSSVTTSTVTNGTIAASTSYAGGFVGAIHEKGSSIYDARVRNIKATANVSYVGGFAGVIYHYATVELAYAQEIDVTAVGGRSAGGFTGELYDYAKASKCFAINANAKGKFYVGGWAGAIYGHTTVEISCAHGKGSAKTTAGYVAGGFAGYTAYTTISNCYAQYDVSTTITGGTAGFVGYFEVGTSVYNTYSAGNVVNYGYSSPVYDGAYSGYSSVKFTGTNYYDRQINGNLRAYGSGGIKSGSASAYPQGYDTAPMMKRATFVGWDFNNIWRIDEDETYPYFWLLSSAKTAAPTITVPNAGATTVSGHGVPGAELTVIFPGNIPVITEVLDDGSWTVSVPGGVTLAQNDIVSASQKADDMTTSDSVSVTVISAGSLVRGVEYEYYNTRDNSLESALTNDVIQIDAVVSSGMAIWRGPEIVIELNSAFRPNLDSILIDGVAIDPSNVTYSASFNEVTILLDNMASQTYVTLEMSIYARTNYSGDWNNVFDILYY